MEVNRQAMMVATQHVQLPTEEELAVQEINLSISALRAGAFHLGKYCENDNNEFMLCKQELSDPRACIEDGKKVTKCALSFFQKVKKSCHEEFTQYANCLFRSSGDMKFSFCRNTQAAFDKCVVDNLGIERADYGYFCRIKVHHTDRPKVVEPPAVYPDAVIGLPADAPKPPANYGNRNLM